MRYKKLVTDVESHASAVGDRERRIALYKSNHQQQQYKTSTCRYHQPFCLPDRYRIKENIKMEWTGTKREDFYIYINA